MISTNTVKPKVGDGPQKLTILTTSKVRLKTKEDMVAAADARLEKLQAMVNIRQTQPYTGPMLTTAGLEDRVMNEKRKRLMRKLKALRTPAPTLAAEPEPKKRRGRPKKTE
jgi:hypothetical protein